ncbi:Protein O-mannosyl-transferase 2 [Umbelopsis nana]
MYSVDIPRRRSVGTEKAMKQKPLVQMFELNVMENGSAGDYGKPSEAAKLALLAQAGAYIPLHRLYDLMFTLTITAISVFVRTYRIEYPPQVVFDEAHFGKFAANYINGTFFFDVHPPLGKLLIAGAGHLSGFDGAYTFETIGGSYEGKVPHVPMRLFCATFGLLTIPIAYLTIRVAGFSKLAGFMAAVLMCFGMNNPHSCGSTYSPDL